MYISTHKINILKNTVVVAAAATTATW